VALSSGKQITFSGFLLQDILDPSHKLVKLAEIIDWEAIHERLRPYYSNLGRRGLPIRLMVGLHLLKHKEGMSDLQVTERLANDMSWMFFCGVDPDSLSGIYSHLNSSSMTKFRNRIGDKGFGHVEAVIRDYLVERKQVDTRVMTTDSSCFEKHVAYPTDSGLLAKGRKALFRGIKSLGKMGAGKIKGLRSGVRRSKKIILEIAKLGKDRQDRIRKGTLELAKMASHMVNQGKKVLSRYRRQLKKQTGLQTGKAKKTAQDLSKQIKIVAHVIKQARARFRGKHLKKKVYSIHEPEVVCIRKGKRGRPNEYGIKFNVSVDKNGFIITHEEQTENIHDAKLLDPALKHWEQVTGSLPKQVNGDRGYVVQEHLKTRRIRKIERLCVPSRGKKKHPQHKEAWFCNGQRLRAQIEGTIGHLKSRGRCHYKGTHGSKTHLTLNCITWNLTKLVKVSP